MKKLIITVLIALSTLSFAQDLDSYDIPDKETGLSTQYISLLSESFEKVLFPPDGWTKTTAAGNGWNRTGVVSSGTAYDGTNVAAHLDDNANCDNWIITPALALPADGSCTLSFWEYTWYRQYMGTGFNQVAISTDMATWDVLYQDLPSADGVWENNKFSLKDYAGQTVYIGFRYKANYEHRWYVDMIDVFFDDEGPVVTDVYGNEALLPVLGAYLNNDMHLYVGVQDASGAKSVSAAYDIGGLSGILQFTESAETPGLWSGSIPAQSAPATGTVVLTLTDLGDFQTVTDPYEIQFVTDGDAPVIKYFSYGEPVLMTQDMPISLTFEDESQIASAVCYYSKDNWVTETSFTMAPSKAHSYTYVCAIPAEPVETFAHVRFEIQDVPGNLLSTDPYNVRWLDGEVVIFDDFESGQSAFWDWTTPGTTWAIVDTESVSPTHSLTDSPGGNYPDETKNRLMTNPMDFSSFVAAKAFFWAKIDVEPEWEFFRVQGTTSTDAVPADGEWVTLLELDGYNQPWESYEVYLGSFAGYTNVRLRLTLDSDNAVNADGVYIDDFRVVGYFTVDPPPPPPNPIEIYYDGPDIIQAENYTIPREFTIPVGMGDYTFTAGIYAASGGISDIKVFYSVDGGDENEAIPDISSGPSGTFELHVPEQPAGSSVKYKFRVSDDSPEVNTVETKYYYIRFGNFLYYQNGDDYIDYLGIIGTSTDASAQAVSKRITMGPMETAKGHYRSNLVGITIDSYISEDYRSDPMYIHVWADDNGQPGDDLITPVYHEHSSTLDNKYEITYVDLRGYPELTGIEGDVFVGFTTAGIKTNILFEVAVNYTGEPGYTAFERSWLGHDSNNDGTVDSWTHEPANVYHISAVIDYYEEVGINPDQITPLKTALYQNYPNPFNPVTQIKYALAKTADVKLNVYNITGQLVSELVKGVMNAGYHAVNFDGSKLNSGIYYYTLEVDGKAVTKRMALIK